MPAARDPYTYSTCISDITLDAMADLYESVGFGSAETYKADEDFIKSIFGAGAYGFFTFTESDHRLVGMARVLSDDKICSWIAEVCVHPDWQGKGVGGRLLDMVINRFGHTAIYVEAFADQSEFFGKYGIKPKKKLIACSRAAQEVVDEDPEPFMH